MTQSGLGTNRSEDLLENFTCTLRFQVGGELQSHILRITERPAAFITDQSLAIQAGHHACENKLMVVDTAVNADGHLAAAFELPQEGSFSQAPSGCWGMLEHLNDVENILIVGDAFDAESSLSNGMKRDVTRNDLVDPISESKSTEACRCEDQAVISS